MKFKYDNKIGRMVGVKTTLLSKMEIERLGGVVPSNRHINPGTGYVADRDLERIVTMAGRYNVTVSRLGAPYDHDVGGFLYRFERTMTV